ncbi:caspase family protein [Aliiruegeria lutimaris]|uniref:Sel1 repeat-containing protein n=1 Tax=Aliiruegeria lutimaris TaxID=571298 RepID=A0A1G8PHK6_9RHOB|nr:caspase family protein [Aliiruegeria lutimaris]SDI91922.1 Sel1 repeat-containing protein [Aliiruegeria lutimaris]
MSRWRTRTLTVPFAVCAVLSAGVLQAQTLGSARPDTGRAIPSRVAIVVGNQDYETVTDLANARGDARDMADLLRSFRFNVFDGYDLDKRGFEELLRQALLNTPMGSDVVFYYAGHGIQIGRRNYLLPVDAAFASIYDVPLETMTLDRVVETLSSRASAHVAILDSCRDNPFPDIRLAADLDANLFETKSGFDIFSTPLNSLIAYSTSPGGVAMDGNEGGNSPYTLAILDAARTMPNENVQSLFPVVRQSVHDATGGKQVPWESSTLVRPFFLTPAVDTVDAEEPAAAGGVGSVDRGMVIAAESDAPIALPRVELDIEKRFDRRVDIGDALQAQFGQPFQTAELVTPPGNGILSYGQGSVIAGRMIYGAEISDIRATELDGHSVSDSFSVLLGFADGSERQVDVDLTLTVDACDLEMGDALDLGGIGVYRLANEIDVAAGLKACEAAVQSDPENGRFLYQLGRAQQSAGMLPEAFANFEAAAEAGHVRALNALSILFDTKRMDREATGIPYDPEMALDLLERGTATGDPYPMHRLGQKLLRNGETAQERRRGFELMEHAIELGHTFAMNELGIYFLTKDTDHYLPERGMRYLRASELHQDIYGYHNLGYVALQGMDGNAPDFDTAFDYFQKSTEGGHPQGPSMIARMILRGQHGEVDTAEAIRWYDMSLVRGDAWGGTNAATVILQGKVPGKGAADAALRAAKAAHLANSSAAEKARERLSEVSDNDRNLALQMILGEIGHPVGLDGAIGAQTLRALETASNAVGVGYDPGNTPEERLLFAARVYWAHNPVRFDLF